MSFKRGVNPHKKLSIGKYNTLEYAKDYASHYTNKSIIDKSYVNKIYLKSQINKTNVDNSQ